MNTNSIICKSIYNKNQQQIQDLCDSKKVRVRFKDNLAMFKYDINADFSDDFVKEARGIIIDINTYEVKCWAFNKFFNNIETQYVDDIDWKTARVFEKIDGSIMSLWWDGNKWIWSSSFTIDLQNSEDTNNFYKLIHSAINYQDIPTNLNKDYTYIFELVSPYKKIVIDYNITKLVHLGTRNNITGKELELNIGIEKPKEYTNLHTITECTNKLSTLNNTNKVNHEGFVVVDANYNRMKIKTKEYIQKHHIFSMCDKPITFNTLYKADKENIINELYDKTNYSNKIIIDIYNLSKSQLYYIVEKNVIYFKALYIECDYNKKSIIDKIKANKYYAYIFIALSHMDYTIEQIIDYQHEHLYKNQLKQIYNDNLERNLL